MPISVVADDLSGAAEIAAVFAGLPRHPLSAATAAEARTGYDGGARVQLVGDNADALLGQVHEFAAKPNALAVGAAAEARLPAINVVDSNSRRLARNAAADRMKLLLGGLPAAGVLFLKFDSLLRGNIGTELAAALTRGPVVFTPAVPANDRIVRGGVLHVEGVPLHQTNLWDAEDELPAAGIAEQLSPAPVRYIGIETIRTDGLDAALAAAGRAGQVAVCDAETDQDLRRIALAVISLGCTAAGSAGLAEALAAVLPDHHTDSNSRSCGNSGSGRHTGSGDVGVGRSGGGAPDAARNPVCDAGILIVLGTASRSRAAQLEALARTGVPVHRVRPEALADFDPGAAPVTAVAVDSAIDPAGSAVILQALTALAVRCHQDRHLVLSGGETARAVLDALGIEELFPLAQAHPGAIVSATGSGRMIATRPGSYGAADSLVNIVTTMQSIQKEPKESTL